MRRSESVSPNFAGPPGVGSAGRLPPTRATVSFQLKQQQRHRSTVHGNGTSTTNNNSSSDGEVREERGGAGASSWRAPAATSHGGVLGPPWAAEADHPGPPLHRRRPHAEPQLAESLLPHDDSGARVPSPPPPFSPPGTPSSGPALSPQREAPATPRPSPSRDWTRLLSCSSPSSSSLMRRTSSLDQLTAPYLAGHWPREKEKASRCLMLSRPVSKATVGLLRSSVESLNQEIERITITHTHPPQLQGGIPDGRRPPPPLLQSHSSLHSPLHQSHRSIDIQTPGSASSMTVSPSPLAEEEREEERDLLVERTERELSSSSSSSSSSSPRPNNSFLFKREPPEGCERVAVFTEHTHSLTCQQGACVGPDRNKVNFLPNNHCSAFILLPKASSSSSELRQ